MPGFYRDLMKTSHPPVDTQTIVVGIDGSSGAHTALEWAVDEARQTARRIVIVHAAPLAEAVVLAPLTLLGFPDATSSGTEDLRRASDYCHRAGVSVATLLAEGSPADCLVDTSDGAAMLVLGARGHGRTAALLLGSVSQDCARRAKCPVVIIKPKAALSAHGARQHDAVYRA